MRKTLSFSPPTFSFLALAILLAAFAQGTYAQCGSSPFLEGGSITPNAAWNSVNIGSGTYVNVNVVAGNIYSFRYTGSTVAGYDWDMTLSTSSSVLSYDNSLTPLRNSWTGGLNCPITNTPLSAEWFSTFTGVIRVNTHLWNGTCHNWTPGTGSATLEYKECAPTGDPGSGVNQWNVDAYVTTDLNIPVPDARYGYYTDPNLNLSTTNFWNSTLSPSTAAGWTGCGEVPNDNFVVRARRTGFPCGGYQLFADQGDDNMAVYLNGTQIFSHGCCINSATVVGNPAGYLLTATDQLEVRFNALCGPDLVLLRLAPVTPAPFDAGTIGGIANNANICEGLPIGHFTDVAPATGGTLGFANSLPIYSWEMSTDGGVTYNPVGVSTPDWNSATTVPPGSSYVIRRRASDACGNTGVSNAIVVVGVPTPNGSLTPANTVICPGGTAILTANFSPGTGPFSFNYTDGLNGYSQSGFPNGGTISVSPAVTSSYVFTAIQDANGCLRTSGFTAGALVQIAPTINITNVAVSQVSCNGGGNGAITVSTSGGYGPLSYSDDGGNTFQASNVFNNLTAGNYNLVVHDSLGCSVTYPGNPVVIGQPTAISFTTTHTDASCSNVFDGTINVSASGGTPAYQYSLNGGPLQPGSSFTGLGAATYNVAVYDRNGCVDSSSVTIINTYIISVSVDSQSNVSCFGAADGSVTVHVNGGIGPYEYSLNGTPFQPSNTFSGLSGGTYIITGRDSKGCTESVNVTISQPTQVTVTIDSISNVSCFGAAAGSIYITPAGGTGPYTYLWSDNSTNEDLTGVVAGTYHVVVTDSKGCTAAGGATIGQPLELFVNIASSHDPLCSGDSTGYIDVIANGGVPPYTYSWSNSSLTEFQTNLPAGNYSVTVSDANGCQKVLSQTLVDPTPLVLSVTATDVSCFGASDGGVDLTVSGGTAPYFYQWSSFQATQDISQVSGGLHYVIVTDNNGCIARDSITVNEPAPLVLTTVVTNISCFNSSDGAIDLTVTGGTGPYTYMWNDNITTQDRTGLPGGTYSVTVTDAHNCTAATSVLLVNPSTINTSFIVTDPLCNSDSNGAIDLLPSGGTPPYTYVWNNTATSEDLTGVPAGTYIVTITDSRGCIRVDSTVVIQPPILYTSGIIKNVSCSNYCDGAIDITAYGGTLPYSYHWSFGPSTEDVVSVCGADYIVTVTDNHACTVASLYTVVEPTPLVATVVSNNVTCFNGNNGHAAVIPSGGTTPYEYLWNTFASDSSLNGLVAGHYVVLLTDSNGCHTYDSTDIAQPLPITITAAITNVDCGGGSNGAISLTVNGGTSPYTYAWSFGPATTATVTGLTAGVYAVTVSDANGCQKIDSFEVKQSVNLYTNVSLSNPVCYGSNNGFIAVDVTGGTVPYTYSWNTTPGQTGAIATNLYSGSYSVTITDAHSCTATITASLSNPQQIVVTTSATGSKCANNATGIVIASVTGGTPPYIYSLNGVNQVSSQSTDTLYNLAPGQYLIEVRDANGCAGTKTFTIDAPILLTVDLQAPQSVILQGMSTELLAISNPPDSAIQYIWSPSDSFNVFDFTGCADTTDCYNPHVAPRYTTTFMVTVMNSDSCFASDTVTITVLVEPKMFIPTAFTPNNDGLNDHFEFDILGATDINIAIFDRWGSRVYANSHQPNGINGHNGWDGTKDGKALPYDTYVYQMKVTYFNGAEKDVAGTINIMK